MNMIADIEYTFKDCGVHVDNDIVNGRLYRVYKGKVIIGFTTEDGGFV